MYHDEHIQPPPPPSYDGHFPLILSQVANKKFGFSANIRNAPKKEVRDVTCAALISKIANNIGTNTMQCTQVATTNATNDADPMKIPADTEAPDINGYPAAI